MSIHAEAQQDITSAQELYEQGEYISAIDYLQSLEIRHSADLTLEGDAHHKLADYETAIESYTQALAREDEQVYAMMRRGAAYLELGELAFALRDIKKALRMWPDHPEANFYMGNICYDQEDMRNAVKFYKEALKSRPTYPQAQYMLGAARSELGHHQEASAAFSLVLNDYPEAKYSLAVVKLEGQEYESAIALFNELEQEGMQKVSDLYFFRAEAYYQIEDKNKACMDYKTAAALGDEEALEIYDQFCLKSKRKAQRKDRDVQRIAL